MYHVYFDSIKILFTSAIDIIVISWVCMSVRAGEASLRVIGGRDVLPGDFPYVVRLERQAALTKGNQPPRANNQFFCTASVLSPTVTLTAEHCCLSLKENHVVVRYGLKDSRPSENDRFSDVLSYILPPGRKYSDTVMRNDVALVTTQPIPLSKYARLSAVDHPALYGRRITVLGHGLTVRGSVINNTLIQRMPLQAVDAMWSKCDLMLQYALYPMACGVRSCTNDAALVCPGDSGGPVLHTSGIVGVTSMTYGGNCRIKNIHENPDNPDIVIIAPLSSYIDWIGDSLSETRSDLHKLY